ncbi:hypothetical protein [Erythrobacter donghaensis]|uniref:hypothetical protein n=1 Tax=Erythrobacter donghaensis TaxID=267135 RepID=UPI000A388ADC|nr:hypothetical protein [Erythrobacter donghaensis]
MTMAHLPPVRAAQQADGVLYSISRAEHRLAVKKREGSVGVCELGIQSNAAGGEFALTISQNQYGRTMMVLGGAKTLFRTVTFAVPMQQDELRTFTLKTLGPAKPGISRVILKTNASTDDFYVGIGGLSADSRTALLKDARSWDLFDKEGVLLHSFTPPAVPLAEALAAFESCNTSW